MSQPVDLRRRRLLFAALYVCEGAPIGYLWWTLPVVLARAGVAPARVGALLGWIVLPWALKFLWAPLVDVCSGPRFGLRDWIAAAQLAMVATLAPLCLIDPLEQPLALTLLLMAHAFAAATQDVAVDALAIRSTRAHERGALNGWMQMGMLLGRGLFGGGALALRAHVGDAAIVLCLCALLLAATRLRRRLPPDGPRSLARGGAFAESLIAALRRPVLWVLLAFAAVGATAFESVGAFAGAYLAGVGRSDAAIGAFLAVPAVVALGLGAFAGGHWSDRVGRRPVLVSASCAASSAALVFAWAPPGPAAWIALALLFAAAGVITSASYALFMDHVDARSAATQFSAAMGATNLCEAWSAGLTGRLAGAYGYPIAFSVAALLGLAALTLLAWPRGLGARAPAES